VEQLKAKGAVFVEDISVIPDGATVIYSAHGVPRAVRRQAEKRGLKVFDATCPLVTKVHMEVLLHRKDNTECVLIGHAGHPEVEGTLGQSDGGMYLVETPEDVVHLKVEDPENLAFITQTTLSMDDTARVIDALRARFPKIKGPKKEDICYATQNRQDAVKDLARHCQVVVVVGSSNSSNANRLREVAEDYGARGYLVDGPQDLQRDWIEGVEEIGVTAGASTPEVLVQGVVARLNEWGAQIIDELPGRKTESVTFKIPRALKTVPSANP
jgi:4-hydroxy-3-methylbut-2-enyl diphosphate reductase